MITVIGEALIDLVSPAGRRTEALTVEARPGGGPYNTARTIGRLGVPVSFAGRLGDDAFGRLLASGLSESDVAAGVSGLSAAPTTLAVASIGGDGAAGYRFYLDGTSVVDLDYQALLAAVPPSVTAVYAASFALALEPIATSVSRLVTRGLPADALLMVDPNCRPGVIPSRAAYLERLTRLAGRTDIVKASVEDLAYMFPRQAAAQAAAGLLSAGARLVLVTDGPHPARAFLASGDMVAAAAAPVEVVDTIGAGDAFGGAFLAWWTRHGLGRAELAQAGQVEAALRFAVEVASITCTRAGADPPRMPIP